MRAEIAHILLADDDAADVELLRIAFWRIKLEVELSVVGDGEQAMRFLRQEGEYSDVRSPDLLLLDINMPRMTGMEVLAEIRRSPALLRLPVVIMTGSDIEEDVLESYALSANCYVRKPVDFEGIQKVVNAIEHFWFSVVTLPPKPTA